MDNLYFTLSSLPHLDPAGPAPFPDMKAFWEYVAHVPEDWRAPWEGGEVTDTTVRTFRDWDLSLRKALARARLESLPWKDQLATLPPGGEEWRERALEVLDRPTPLETEQALDALRWEFLEELGQGHLFDRQAFFIYVLKLELVQRRSNLVRERGLEVFDALHAQVLARTDLTIPTGEQS